MGAGGNEISAFSGHFVMRTAATNPGASHRLLKKSRGDRRIGTLDALMGSIPGVRHSVSRPLQDLLKPRSTTLERFANDQV